jgi:hypothetical protein
MNLMKPENCAELGPTWVGDFALLGATVHHYSPPTAQNLCGKIPLIIQCIIASNVASDLDSNAGAQSSRDFRLLLQTYSGVLSHDNFWLEYSTPLVNVFVNLAGVGIDTGYGLDDRGAGVRVTIGSRIFSSPRCSDRLWGPPSLLSNGHRVLFLRG